MYGRGGSELSKWCGLKPDEPAHLDEPPKRALPVKWSQRYDWPHYDHKSDDERLKKLWQPWQQRQPSLPPDDLLLPLGGVDAL